MLSEGWGCQIKLFWLASVLANKHQFENLLSLEWPVIGNKFELNLINLERQPGHNSVLRNLEKAESLI